MRKAAAALHGMGDADRALILGELEESDRQALCAYLDELDALGFARIEATSERDALSAAAPNCMHRLLAAEPDVLVGQVLALRAWPWRAAFLAKQNAARRTRLSAMAQGSVPPAMAAALLQQLEAGLASLPVEAAPMRRWSWLWR